MPTYHQGSQPTVGEHSISKCSTRQQASATLMNTYFTWGTKTHMLWVMQGDQSTQSTCKHFNTLFLLKVIHLATHYQDELNAWQDGAIWPLFFLRPGLHLLTLLCVSLKFKEKLMFNITMHTLKEDECGICKGWKQLAAGRPNTPKLLSCLTPVRYPATQSLWQESKDTAKDTCQPQREMGKRAWQIILVFLTC